MTLTEKILKEFFESKNIEYTKEQIEKFELLCSELIKFNEDGICIGRIENISADESVLDENGRIDVKKLNPIIYDGVTHAYLSVGDKVGQAFSDGKKIK